LANEENTLSISNILSLCKGLTMPSFDIVSELELFEVNHAVQNTEKEIATRFDFRGQDVSIELNEKIKKSKSQLKVTSNVNKSIPCLKITSINVRLMYKL
jgi:uncharacterized protein YajQ (UPF0234 family)